MVANLNQFLREVQEFSKSVPAQVVTLHKKIALEALSRIVAKTPVDTGRARGNWQTTINSSPSEELFLTDPVGNGAQALQILGAYQAVIIANNVPYIIFLEQGSSQQAPSGMVMLTVEELRGMFN